jgi:hypothetical protein
MASGRKEAIIERTASASLTSRRAPKFGNSSSFVSSSEAPFLTPLQSAMPPWLVAIICPCISLWRASAHNSQRPANPPVPVTRMRLGALTLGVLSIEFMLHDLTAMETGALIGGHTFKRALHDLAFWLPLYLVDQSCWLGLDFCCQRLAVKWDDSIRFA